MSAIFQAHVPFSRMNHNSLVARIQSRIKGGKNRAMLL
jgi:hypothetical protein